MKSTLVLHTPKGKVEPDKWSFERTISEQKGNAFGFLSRDQNRVGPGDEVIVFQKATKRQVIGKITRIVRVAPTPGIARFDIHFADVKPMDFTLAKIRLPRQGITLIDASTSRSNEPVRIN